MPNMAIMSSSSLDLRRWGLFLKPSSSLAEGLVPHASSAKPSAVPTLSLATAAELGAGVRCKA
eukprot:434634-Pyramimonas_sp.AAC.1